jgi:signal transduction histidine kinase
MWGAPLGWRAATRLDALLAVLLSAVAVLLVSGAGNHGDPKGGVLACAAVLLMTAPVAWRRAHPVGAIATLAVGALFNAVVVGTFVRCGATLPSLALVVFSVGARCELRSALSGAALAIVATVTEAHSDPRLTGFSVGGSILLLALWGVGRLAGSRDAMVAALRARTGELREQRDRTARLAVAADRVRVAESLDGMLGQRVGWLGAEAAAARGQVDRRPDAARESLSAIEQQGRETLAEMRQIVGSLRDEPSVSPQPTLEDLETLLGRVLGPSARLTVEGERQRLPAGVELSAFRIIERLLESLDDVADARVWVRLRYEPDALQVGVDGRVRAGADLPTTLATAREWVSLHAGTLESQLRLGVLQADVRLPLVTAYA